MQRWLRRIGIAVGILVAVLACAALVLYVWSERIVERRYTVRTTAIAIPGDAASIAEGRRLATVHGCMNGCHGKQGQGVVFFNQPVIARLVAPNLTTVVQRYSDAELVGILRNGLRPDGTSVFVMPSECFAYLTDVDTGRIVAFLHTLAPLAGPNASRSLGPGARVGIVTGKFKMAAQMIAERPAPPDSHSAAGEHGRNLARTVCAGCHGATLQGDSNPDFTSPDLRIVAAYSADDFVRLLRTGIAMGDRKLGVMRGEAQDNLSSLTDAEIAALYEYLHALAGG